MNQFGLFCLESSVLALTNDGAEFNNQVSHSISTVEMSIICSGIILRVDDPLCPNGVERAMSVIIVLFLVFQNQVMGDISDPQVIEPLSCILLMHRWLPSAEDNVGWKICSDSFTASLFNVQLNVAEKVWWSMVMEMFFYGVIGERTSCSLLLYSLRNSRMIHPMPPVHDEQLVDDIPAEKLLVHDVPVDIICTPTRVIFTNTPIPKPKELEIARHGLGLKPSESELKILKSIVDRARDHFFHFQAPILWELLKKMKKEAPLVYPQERLESGKGEGRYGRDIESADDQLCNRVPLILSQVPVDIICTPTRVIFTNTPIPKPKGICWNKLSPEKLGQIQMH
ncbi:hypothetical protein Nepgr_033505 [Nepenthes gracilis]|uniref:Uncharacterized protein n=1 Tax=Nepenthes gracilis TaxID=150966 RepID=A0AAD3TM22_NEPGR|nr:hypothetical protein Nepgr_033505 [Nepenthes gracilis]